MSESSWEEQMAAKAAARAVIREAEEITVEALEPEEKPTGQWRRFEGLCDVCGDKIAYTHWLNQGLIDVGVNPDGSAYTWIRHPGGPRDGCRIYSTVVHEVASGVTSDVD